MLLDPVRGKVLDIKSREGRPLVHTADGHGHSADLVIVAGGLSRTCFLYNVPFI